MKKTTATESVKALGKYYMDTVNKINAIRANRNYSDSYKKETISQIVDEYNATCGSYKAKVTDSVNAIQAGLAEKRQAEIEKGLASAEVVNNIVNGIKGGIYTSETMRDLVAIYADNAYALKAIRGACLSSDDESYKSVGLEIPVSNDDKISRNLDNIINGINDMPSPLATENGQGKRL